MMKTFFRHSVHGIFLRVLSFIVVLVGISMIPSVIMSAVWREDGTFTAFVLPMGLSLLICLPLLFFTRKQETRFSIFQGLLLVCLAWVCSCLLWALPFTLSGLLPNYADAVFESASGFTTTGATVFVDAESLPRSLLFWRAMTHWLGGMGLVVLTVALAPLLGVGGFQLTASFDAENPGPESGKITPKLTGTANIHWFIYMGLTILAALFLFLGGMSCFDAITHAFSTMATGGFSTRNSSIAAWHSSYIEWVCIVFMFLAGFNFNLIYSLLRGRLKDIFRNSEAKTYFRIIFASVAVITLVLAPGKGFVDSIRLGFFHTLSILTTTGFAAENHILWPPLAQTVLFFLMFVGGCSGSTAGGIKIIRHLILFKQTGNEAKKLLYPRGVFTISLNKKEGSKSIVYGVAGFVFLYALLVLAATLVLSTAGLELFDCLNLGLLTVGNIGLGFVNNLELTVFNLPAWIKWVLSFVMIAGRLELWTVFAIFSHDWRRA
jgi:trk system potassium uptake protein TrkH